MEQSILAPKVFREYHFTKKKKIFWIISSWRSGSTFLASLIENLPGVFYNYEPLYFLGVNNVVKGRYFSLAKRVIDNIMNCRYGNKAIQYFRSAYIKHGKKRICQSPSLCLDGGYLAQTCKMSPIFAFKTVKMTLHQAERYINNPDIDLKIIHLVRDPRAVWNSRNHVTWCNKDCSNIKYHCNLLQGDLLYADKELKNSHPNRYLRVRYEDICDDPIQMTKHILKFLNIPYTNHIQNFVISHTSGSTVMRKWNTIFRDAKRTRSKWRQDLPLKAVKQIQNRCSFPIKYLGYDWYTSRETLHNISQAL